MCFQRVLIYHKNLLLTNLRMSYLKIDRNKSIELDYWKTSTKIAYLSFIDKFNNLLVKITKLVKTIRLCYFLSRELK